MLRVQHLSVCLSHCSSGEAASAANAGSAIFTAKVYWLTRVVPDKGPLNGCVCVCVCMPSVL